MELKLVSRAILLAALFKIICGQCLVTLELHQFQNPYNVVLRPENGADEICCCDQYYVICEDNLDQFSLNTCSISSLCDTYFVISPKECFDTIPCPMTIVTDHISDSPKTTNVNYEFLFNNTTSALIEYEVVMRDYEGEDSFREIDTFNIAIPFASGNQEESFTGNRGIAIITLSYDIVCIEPDACSTSSATEMEETATSMEMIATTDVISTTSTSCPIATCIAIATSTVTTTDTIIMCPSTELQPENGSTGSLSDGASLAWMSLFILFFLLTIGSVMVSVYLACLLKKKSKQKSKTNSDVILVHNSAINPMDNPVYGSQKNKEAEQIQNAAPSPQYYCTLDNNLYANKGESAHHDYSECGPEESSPIGDHKYDYIQTKHPAKIECPAYEVPVNAVRSK